MLKYFLRVHFAFIIFLMVLIFAPLGFSQVDLAQQAYAIFEQSCLNCLMANTVRSLKRSLLITGY